MVLNLIALAMLALMFFNIRQKYTAVGRLEILHFFGIYSVAVVLEFFLVGGFIPMASQAYTVKNAEVFK